MENESGTIKESLRGGKKLNVSQLLCVQWWSTWLLKYISSVLSTKSNKQLPCLWSCFAHCAEGMACNCDRTGTSTSAISHSTPSAFSGYTPFVLPCFTLFVLQPPGFAQPVAWPHASNVFLETIPIVPAEFSVAKETSLWWHSEALLLTALCCFSSLME